MKKIYLFCSQGMSTSMLASKMQKVAMVKKMKPDVVICGPAFNYPGYAQMCAILANEINNKTDIPAIASMSKENEETISDYKDLVNIVVMPKKGGTGLSESLRNICTLAKKKVNGEDISEYTKKVCY